MTPTSATSVGVETFPAFVNTSPAFVQRVPASRVSIEVPSGVGRGHTTQTPGTGTRPSPRFLVSFRQACMN
jgi:hypothetical protein